MKASLSWLREYVDIDAEAQILADALTMVGLEVETVVDRYAYLADVVVGRIVDLTPHPEGAGLSVCKVDTGRGMRSIVCGATNVRKGLFVPVALPGAHLPSDQKIAVGRIRGEVSEGMLCSDAELALGTDAGGILLLPETARLGDTLATVLGLSDPVIECSITPNRSDCLSIIGIAREVAAILKKSLKYPDVRPPEEKEPIDTVASVTIDAPDHCPRYVARVLSDVHIGPSPFWMQDRLRSVGLRPINNVVDVTNFVMMEIGQPLHAFDFDRLAENRIVVRTAGTGQVFTTLDGAQRNLSADALMICDGKRPVALAGIMGGLDSEIEEDTKRVLIESAYFNPTTIRRTAKRLGLSTESSHRFERGVDPTGTVRAADRAAQLMVELAGGSLAAGVIDAHPKPTPRQVIDLSVKRTNRLLGTSLGQAQIASHLRSVELSVEVLDEDRLTVTPPGFRVDLRRPEDLMEEVARLNGYDQIPTTLPVSQVVVVKEEKGLEVRDRLREILVGCGFSETISYSFIGRNHCDRLLLADDDVRRRMLPILNPLTEDQDMMRTSLLPGLLTTMLRNSTQRNENLRVFEIGKVFYENGRGRLPDEVEMVSGLWTGARRDRAWYSKEHEVDFYDIKGVVETLCDGLGVSPVRFSAAGEQEIPHLRPGRAAHVFVGKSCLGSVGQVSPQVLENYDLKRSAYCFDVNFDILVGLMKTEKMARPIPRFPSTTRDLALILEDAVETQSILDFIACQDQPLIEKVEVFDVYTGSPVPTGKKSVALRLTYQSFERSLTDSEVNEIQASLTDKALKQFDAQLPVK
jgi:phenylalanyl-tRNA synthetase beta chain